MDLDVFIRQALAEDVGAGDHTTLATIPPGAQAEAVCRVKDNGVLAGVEVVRRIFQFEGAAVAFEAHLNDGDVMQVGQIAFTLRGDARTILTRERLALNLLQRMSGVATTTRRVVNALEGTGCKLLDTRKTAPLLRYFDKWAVRLGGGQNHRFGLDDMILIKDNHIDYAGGIRPALERAHAYLKANGLALPIVIETRSLTEVAEALATGGVTRILLDNMALETLRQAVALTAGRCPLEASGGVTPESARQIAETGVDYVSMGLLTHSVRAADLSLKISRVLG